jgi:hypothetical protein
VEKSIMRGPVRTAIAGVLVVFAGTAGALRAGQQPPQGVGQVPAGPLPLSAAIREKGTSVTPAFEGWYFDKDGSQRLLVGYFNRNTKQELDIPVGPNNHIDGLPGGPDQGQPTHFLNGRQWGVVSIKVPKDFGSKKATWTLVANGLTSTITLHTKAEYIVEPFEDAANKNTPPKLKFDPAGAVFTGPPNGTAATYTATVGTALPLTIWVSDEAAKINVREPAAAGRGRGRGTAAAADPDAAAGDQPPARGAARGGRGAAGAAGAAATAGFTPAPPLSITWTVYRGPGPVKFEPSGRQGVDQTKDSGKQTTNATFSQPGDYILRLQSNDSTGDGGGGFQCCWTNTHIAVSVKPAPATK